MKIYAPMLLAITGIFLSISPINAANRVALVIGNGAYEKVPVLPNPTRDAADIGDSLSRLGFTVTRLNDGTASSMRKSIVEFGRAAEGSDMAVVFYAGHGMEAGGENWLIPIDAELRNDTDVESEAVSLRSISLQVSKARQLGLVILDACRNNPFEAKMRRSLGTRAVTRGLAPTEPTDNVLVAYAARDGTTASDGVGRNSPFTTALLRNIETPGLEISFLFRNVRDEVMVATKREQQPFVYGSLSKEAIYLKAPLTNVAPITPTQTQTAPPTEDEQFWQAISTSRTAGLYEEFLVRYPKSSHIAEARERLVDLKSKQVASVTPQTSVSESTATKPNQLQPSQGQSANDASQHRRALYTSEDAQRVAQIADRLALKMPTPPFQIADTSTDVQLPFQKFVGIWSNKLGWDHGKGRHGMLIVTQVQSDGLALGFYLWGPPTKLSWENTPAGYMPFTEKLSGNTLSLKTSATNTIEAKLVGDNSMVLHSAYLAPGKRLKTSSTEFSPIWRLVSVDASPERPSNDPGKVAREPRRVADKPETAGPGKVLGQSFEDRYRACRKLVKGFAQRDACARNGV